VGGMTVATLTAHVGLNDRISPEYLDLQRTFHKQAPHYGTMGNRYAGTIRGVMRDYNLQTALDYGCGKGLLKYELGEVVTEYDPAIPGKDGLPERADLVVCTDVLEHIEPERLDSVLEHIRTLGDYAFFVIATRPAEKDLPDGRNAHLIVRDAEWWKNKLANGFDIKACDIQEGFGLQVFAKPFILIGEIKGVGVLDYSERMKLIRENIKTTKNRLRPRKFIYHSARRQDDIPMFGLRVGFDGEGKAKWAVPMPHDRVAIVMCYGPSLADTWQLAISEKDSIEKADVISVSGAHDFLIERGIIPAYHVECDPRKHKGDMIAKPHKKVRYYMASCCHPDVVRKVAGENLTLWHMNEGEQSLQILDLEPNSILVPGGGSVGLRTIALLYIMGYRRFIIHGMDCSYRDEKSHAGHHTGKKVDPVEVRCADGRKFMTAPVLITYKRYFDDLRRSYVGDADADPSKIEIILRGDGLLQHWLKVAGGASGHETQRAA
jgi:uncharacterized Rossmann fold enzyme